MNSIWRHALTRAIARHGIAGTASRIPHYLDEIRFDLVNGVRTAGRLDPDAEAWGGAAPYAYAPVPARGFAHALTRFGLATDGTFVDVGCGKGRVLIIAARHGFDRVVGLELVAELCLDAERNLASYERRRRAQLNATIACVNAADYRVQPDETVFFLYNPFPAGVLRSVLGNIRASRAMCPRDVSVIYAYPEHDDVFAEDGAWLRADSVTCAGFCEIVLYHPA